MTRRTVRKKCFALLSALCIAWSGPFARAEDAVSEEAVEAEAAETPRWLEAARRHYDAALVAREAGDGPKAEKHLRKAFKSLAKAPRGADFSEAYPEMEALFIRLQEKFAPTSRPAPEPAGLDVSDEELERAPLVGTPAPVGKKAYSIPIDPHNPLVKKYIAIYTGPRRRHMEHALERMGLYKSTVLKTLKEAGLPRELLYLPIAESEYANAAVSRAGAVGLWQIMPATGRNLGLKINFWVDERRDPQKATRAAAKYLKYLHQWFDDWHLALAAYNRGEYGVQRDMKGSRSPGFEQLSHRKALPNETEHYVPKFMACVLIADNPASYGFQAVEATPPPTDEVVLGKPVDLKVAARAAGTTEETLRALNPTLQAWCTPKNDADYALKIPAGTKDSFLAALAQIKDWTPGPETLKYKVQRGDVLGKIAGKFRTTAAAIQKDNNIKDPRKLRPGQVLSIRPGKGYR
ncbi:MAG: transglycosylase SLT domain-containing protein [Elusimicrobiota bacterium]